MKRAQLYYAGFGLASFVVGYKTGQPFVGVNKDANTTSTMEELSTSTLKFQLSTMDIIARKPRLLKWYNENINNLVLP